MDNELKWVVILERDLNLKQKKFADYYIELGNATEAAIKAGYKSKYAGTNADKLLKNTNVMAYLEKRLAEIESDRIAKPKEILEYFTSVMRRELCEHVVVTLTEEQSTYSPDENGTMRKKTVKRESPEIVRIPAKLTDANKAAVELAKRFGLDKPDESADNKIEIILRRE